MMGRRLLIGVIDQFNVDSTAEKDSVSLSINRRVSAGLFIVGNDGPERKGL